MKPAEIRNVLDLASRARKLGLVFNPLFVGPPGVGKSQIVQQWCKENDLQYIDIRAAFYEAPDIVGFPSIQMVGDRQRTVHALPEMWPTEGKGVILLEEPNRGTTSVLNTFMQMLTDRKIGINYEIPEGWMIVGCINPESEHYDVNTMDPALKDRFEIFNVEYDHDSFVEYMVQKAWSPEIIAFVESKTWTYRKPEDVGKAEGNKYISPRTLSKLNAAMKAGGLTGEFERTVYESILGRNMGMSFYTFKYNEQPVLFKELKNPKTYKAAIEKLKVFANPEAYRAGSIAITIRDIVNDGTIEDVLLSNVILALPADQGPRLVSELEFKRGLTSGSLLTKILNDFPDVKKYLKNVLKQA
jgi:hypothetical protein